LENKKEKAFLSPLPSFRPFWPKPHAPFWAEAQLAGSLPPLSLWRLTGGAHSSDPPPSSNRPPPNLPLSAKPPRSKPPLPRSPLPAPRSLSWRAPRARAFSPSHFLLSAPPSLRRNRRRAPPRSPPWWSFRLAELLPP
jgi:hypothetical protein